MRKQIDVYEGTVMRRDDTWYSGPCIDDDSLYEIMDNMRDKKVRITIEVLEE